MDRKGKHVSIRVIFLDDQVHAFQIHVKAYGSQLWEAVIRHMNLLEADYFDLEFEDIHGLKCWLDKEKQVLKQLSSPDTPLRFLVKFYMPDPALLEDELTRYLFALQVKRDLAQGSLTCSDNTMALLASYVAQAEVGDFPIEEYSDHTYLRANNLRYVPRQTEDLERKIMEYHKQHVGETPAEADINLLDTARKVELYGIRMNPAKDHENVSLNLAVSHSGIHVFQGYTKINTFSWAKIRKLSFKRKRFLIKLHPENCGYYKDLVEFFFESRDDCKGFWKKCIEHHGFYRCQIVKKIPRNKTRVVSRGSSFRYAGRTQKQLNEYIRESFPSKRPQFERTVSGRISSRSTSVTPKIPAKVSLHNSADLHNDTASSGSHVLDQTQSTLHYGNDETVEVHSESSVSGSRSLNSPKLERIQSHEEEVPREEVVDFVQEREDEGDAMVSMETQDQGACNIFTSILTTNLDDVVVNESYNVNIIETAHASSANQNVDDSDDRASHDDSASHDEYASHDENLSHDDASHDDNFSQTSQASYHLDSCDTDTYDQSNSMSLPSELKFSSLDHSDSLSLPSDVRGHSFDQSDSIHSGLSEDDLLEGEKLYLQSITNIGDGDIDDFVDNVVEPLFEAQAQSLHITAKNAEALNVAAENVSAVPFISSEEVKVGETINVCLNDNKKEIAKMPISADVVHVSDISIKNEETIAKKLQESAESDLGTGAKAIKADKISEVLKPKRIYDLEDIDFPYMDDSQDELEPSSCILAAVESDEDKTRKQSTDTDVSCLPNGTAVIYSADISEAANIAPDVDNNLKNERYDDKESKNFEVTESVEDTTSANMIDDIPYYLHRRHIVGDVKRKKETELYTALANAISTSGSPASTESRRSRSLKRPQNMQVQQLKADEIPFQPPPISAAKRTPSASPGRSPGRISPSGLTLDFSVEGRRSRKLSGSSHSRSPSGGRNRMELINYHKLPKKTDFSSVDDTANSPPMEEDVLSYIPEIANTAVHVSEADKTENKEMERDIVTTKQNSGVKKKTSARIMKQDSVLSEGSDNLTDLSIGGDLVISNEFQTTDKEQVLPASFKDSSTKHKRTQLKSESLDMSSEITVKRKAIKQKSYSCDSTRNRSDKYEGSKTVDLHKDKLEVSKFAETDLDLIEESNIGAVAADSLTRNSAVKRKSIPKLSELNTKGKSYEEQEWEDLIQKLRKEDDDTSPVDLQPSDILRPLDETINRPLLQSSGQKNVYENYYDLQQDTSYTAASILLSQSYYQNYTTHHDCVDSSFPTFKATPSASPMGSRSSTSLSSLGDSPGAITMSLSHDAEDIQMEEKSIIDYTFDIQDTESDEMSAPHHAVIRRNLSPCRLREYTTQSCKEVRVHSNSEDDDSDIVRKRHSYHGETSESALSKQRKRLLEPKRVSFHETVEEIQSEPYPSSSSSDEKQSDKDKESDINSPDIPPSLGHSVICHHANDSDSDDNLSQVFEEGISVNESNLSEENLSVKHVVPPTEDEDSDASKASSGVGGRSGSESDDESECSDEGADIDKTNEFLKFARSLAESGKESTADSGVGDSMTNTTEPSPSESLKKLENLQETHIEEQESELRTNSNTVTSSVKNGKDVSDIAEDISSSSSGSDVVDIETNKRPSIDPLESLEQLEDSYVSSDEDSFEGEAAVEAD